MESAIWTERLSVVDGQRLRSEKNNSDSARAVTILAPEAYPVRMLPMRGRVLPEVHITEVTIVSYFRLLEITLTVLVLNACSSASSTNGMSATGGMAATSTPTDPDIAAKAPVDRFSDAAGHLQVRSASPMLPGPNEAVNFDQGPFITQGFGPKGEVIKYYNFDVQPTMPAPIYALMKGGKPVAGQLNIVDVLPGDAGYNDFWQVVAVTVPDTYVANT